MVNNRAWIPQLLIADVLTALHTESHKCERELLGQRERPPTQSPQRTPANQRIHETNPQTPPPTEAAAQQQEELETQQPEMELEHREPAQEQRAPARVPRAPAREPAHRAGVMDRKNYSNNHTDNIIGDVNAGRSTRSRPNGPSALAAHGELERMSPFELLGKSLWEIVRMARTMDGMADRENGPYRADHDNGDNEILLEQSNWRQNELSASRQPPDEVRR